MTADTLHQQIDLLSRFIDRAGWQSSPRALSEALPHLKQRLDHDDILATLQNLELPFEVVPTRLSDLMNADAPCLFLDAHGAAHLCFQKTKNGFLVHDAQRDELKTLVCDRSMGRAVRLVSSDSVGAQAPSSKVTALFGLLRPVLGALLVVSLFTNIVALAAPLMIMMLYDRAIPTGATDLIVVMAMAFVLIVAVDLTLRGIRARAIAYIGAQAETRLSIELFKKLCRLPLVELEKNSVDQQITRLKQFEGLRDAFSGPVFSAVLDLPFLVLFIATIFFISQPIGWLVTAAAVSFCFLAILQGPSLKSLNAESLRTRNDHQRLIYETIQHQQSLSRLGLDDIWEERQAVLAERAAKSAAEAKRFQLASQAFGQSVMTFSGVGAIIFGTHMAMQGSLSLGGLIAIMALVWRALAPLQALYGCIPQLIGFLRSGRQIEKILDLPEILLRGPSESAFRVFAGSISTEGMSHRFSGAATLALSQIDFSVHAAECLTISGGNGAGKSALLDILGGLYTPLAGLVTFDGVNYQQIAADDLRNMISYARQDAEFFHGTIAQNIRFTHPLATDDDIWSWLDRLGFAGEVRALPEGLDTRVTEGFRRATPQAFFQKLNLARCLIKPAAVYLLDAPGSGLADTDRDALITTLTDIKKSRTLIMATNDEAHIALSDRCAFLKDGRLLVNDAGGVGRKKVSALLHHAHGLKHE